MTRQRTWTDDQLTLAVAASRSMAQVLTALGLQATGANYAGMRRHIERLGLDSGHFTGQRWAAGGPSPRPGQPLAEILVENSTYGDTTWLKRRLLAAGLLENHCYRCELTEWLGEPISLQLEHRNGNHRDHRLANLCLLCPNCHSQTPTFAGRNKGRVGQLARAVNLKS